MQLLNPNVEDMKVGLVDYDRNERIPDNVLVPFFRKRNAYSYEQEARLVANIERCIDVRDDTGKLNPPRNCLELQIDLNAFVGAIRIHPEADVGYTEVVKSLVSKYAPELLGRVETSEMAKPPVF